MTIKTVIIEDQVLVTAAYKSLLLQEKEIEIVGEATNELDAIQLIQKMQPDVVLMDIQLETGNGLTVTEAIHKTCPNTHVLVLSQYKDLSMVHKMINAGAVGFITKTSNPHDLIAGIKAAAEGKTFFCDELKDDYINIILNPKTKKFYHDINLTPREKEIIQHVAEGKTPDEIATHLRRSKRTVEVYLGRIYKKLDINKSIHLVNWAKNNPWVYV
jgi:DNA-binding NarL/FixJ family response regulator